MATDTIRVISGLPNGKVALFEKDPRHPGGEVYVAADADNPDDPKKNPEVEVFKTPLVMKYLGEGRLVEAGKKAKEEIKSSQ